MDGFILFLVFAAAVIGAVIYFYNGIVQSRNAVERAWADVITWERKKNKTLPKLEELAKHYVGFEGAVMTKVAELRSSLARLSSSVDPAALAEVERHTASLLKGINIAVEAYPDLKASDLLEGVMREFSELQHNIAAALTVFNRNVESFNNAIQTFPGSMVNSRFNRERKIRPFTDAEAQAGFDYRPLL